MKIKDKSFVIAVSNYTANYLRKIKSISENTIQSYIKGLELYINYLIDIKGIKINNICSTDFSNVIIIDFLEYLKQTRNNSNNTLNQRLSALKSFARYLHRNHLITYDNYANILDIDKLKSEKYKIIELSIEDIKYILALPDTKNYFGLRDLAYMTLLYDTGCRDSEILNLKPNDVVLKKACGKISVIGKGNKFRSVPLSNEAVDIIKKYIEKYKIADDSFLFYTTRNGITTRMSDDNAARILKKYEILAKKSGYILPHLHPHLFRHARAMHLYHAGMPMQLVCEWLGHSYIETSMIYAYADFDMKKKALQKLDISVVNSNTIENVVDEEELMKKFFGFKL